MEDREVVTVEEQNYIINWSLKNWKSFIYNDLNGGYYIHTNMISEIYNDELLKTHVDNIEKRIIEKENLHKFNKCLYLDDFLYYMDSGTKLHLHKDRNDINGFQIRFNVCIQKPESGGLPFYSGKKIDIIERCYIICRAGIDMHTGGKIYGSKPKIVLSFGFSIKKDFLHLYSNRENIIV